MSNSAPATLNLHSVIKNINSVAWQQHASLERKDARIFDIFTGESGQRVALVHCAPGASAKSHLHNGHETFLILEGTFEDDNGVFQAGDLICYEPGSQHAWRTPEGALIYAVWGGSVESAVVDVVA